MTPMEGLLLDVAVKGTLALLATAAVASLLRHRPAATRHAVWTMGMASALALPLLSRLLPGWTVALLPAAPSAPPLAAATVGGALDWARWLGVAWLAGAAAVASTLVAGRLRIWWIARRSAPLDHGAIPAAVTALCGELRIARPVAVRLCHDRVMPMVWGVLRPVILLPAEATGWSPELRRSVLLHELAHVRRHDYLNQIVARLACAVHWFNPLVWVAARRLRTERERACDDHVLGTGASACDYAEHLVAVARRLRPAGGPALGVAMADPSAFGQRVAALLDSGRARGLLTAGLLARSGLGAACLVLPLAALHPGARGAADAEAPPPAQLIGPPPSANARAAGALPEVREAEPAPESARPSPHARPSSPARRDRSALDGVTVVRVPVIRAVVESGGSARRSFAPGEARAPRAERSPSECTTVAAPAPALRAARAADHDLVWIPAAGANP